MTFAALLCCCTGCHALQSGYGRTSDAGSVNGTGVLADMFREAGHEVSVWPWLSPRIQDKADVVVWFPDDFKPPSAEVRTWLEDWLVARPGRTLIYVGRDFDGASFYWDKVRAGATGAQQTEISRRLADARNEFNGDRSAIPADEDAEWFRVQGKLQPRQVRTLSGKAAWLADIDPAKLEIELNGRLLPGTGDELILESNGDALVTRAEWGDSQLFVVTNGSPLLNVMLVNHEHRKLAGHLIDEAGPAPKQVYFMNSNTPELRIYSEDPRQRGNNPLDHVLREPLDHVMLQLAILGLAFAWSRLPIFGIPKKVAPPSSADFGQHVAAVGELLEKTRDEQYARDKLSLYRQLVRHDVPRDRLKAPPKTPFQPPT